MFLPLQAETEAVANSAEAAVQALSNCKVVSHFEPGNDILSCWNTFEQTSTRVRCEQKRADSINRRCGDRNLVKEAL